MIERFDYDNFVVEKHMGIPATSIEADARPESERVDDLFRDLANLYSVASELRKQRSAVLRRELSRVETALKLYTVLVDSAVHFGWLDLAERVMLDERLNEIKEMIREVSKKRYGFWF